MSDEKKTEPTVQGPLEKYLAVVGKHLRPGLVSAAYDVTEALELAEAVAEEVFAGKAYTPSDVIAIAAQLETAKVAVNSEPAADE